MVYLTKSLFQSPIGTKQNLWVNLFSLGSYSFQSPIGTNKTRRKAGESYGELLFQSPIGTNKNPKMKNL